MIPQHVRDLHGAGWSLVPVGPDKRPLLKWKQFQQERAPIEQIEAWERDLRPAVWGGVTGQISERFTLDFDGEKGEQSLQRLGLEPHRITPSGGFHVDFDMPSTHVSTVSGKTKKNLAELYPGVDVRGDGGYANLLGSTSRGEYRWVSDVSPRDHAALPGDLRQLLELDPPPPQVVSSAPVIAPAASVAIGSVVDEPSEACVELIARALGMAGEGRNVAGFWLATQLRDHRVPHADARMSMVLFAQLAPATNPRGEVEPYTEAEALASLEQAFSASPRPPFLPLGRVIMAANRQLADILDDAVSALEDSNNPPWLFSWGGKPARIVRPSQAPAIERLDVHDVVFHLSRVANWVKPGREEPVPVFPPPPVARGLLAMPAPPFPRLEGVIEAPTLRPDGSLLLEAGYDVPTGLFLEPSQDVDSVEVPESPTRTEIDSARNLLERELLGEFAFADEPSRANALGLLLSLALRPTIGGLVPLALLDAPIAGTGKSLLSSVISNVASGRPAAFTTPPGSNDEELRKRITSLLLAGSSLVVFDNVAGIVNSSVLSQVLTADLWSDRILGVSKMAKVPNRAVWAITGNNIELGGDLHRRCYAIRLDPMTAHPWRRAFKRPDLLRWASENRAELLQAVLTIGRAWFAAGCPAGSTEDRPWGTYFDFSRVIGGMLTHAGIHGFLDNLESMQDRTDQDALRWAGLLQVFREDHSDAPVRTRQLLDSINMRRNAIELPAPLATSLAKAANDHAEATRLAASLGAVAARRFDDCGLRIEDAGHDGNSKAKLWRITTDDRPSA